jgi:hypothetical protein
MSEEPSDPKETLEELCRNTEKCKPLWLELIKCEERVEKNPERGETCLQELFDLTPCIDQCVMNAFIVGFKKVVFISQVILLINIYK